MCFFSGGIHYAGGSGGGDAEKVAGQPAGE